MTMSVFENLTTYTNTLEYLIKKFVVEIDHRTRQGQNLVYDWTDCVWSICETVLLEG